ncbi:MAG: radical SAM family heme chaperone HemW [Gemmatimonadales bacterium]
MHLYLHVPFCARRCSYCDFAIAVRKQTPDAEYLAAIEAEWRWHREAGAFLGPIETLYLGGGTPSRLGAEAIARLVELVDREGPLAEGAEVTLEVNPEDVSPSRAAGWLAAGIGRVSLGIQSFDDDVLRWMHRVHDRTAAIRAVEVLRAAGLENLSLDLIYGLPAQLERDWEDDLETALALRPDHLSFYGLTVEERTPLSRWVDRGVAVPAPDARFEAEYQATHRALVAGGFRHYEVSNAGLPGKESRHNLAYWTRRSYLGLGPSAHSFHDERRWWNEREWVAYRDRVRGGAGAVAGEERLTPAQVALETRYLDLRTDRGIAASSLPVEVLSTWLAAGWARRVGSQVALTADGWLRLDALVGQVE